MQGIMGGAAPGADEEVEVPEGEEREGGGPDGDEQEGGSGNEAYDAGMQLVRQALYEQGGAKDIAKTLTGDNPAQALAEQAYKIIEIADERTMGEIPDDMLVEFAIDVLSEVAEIAEAAGGRIDGSVIAEAFSSMLKKFLESQGLDGTQVAQAMDQMNQGGQVGAVLDQAAEQEM